MLKFFSIALIVIKTFSITANAQKSDSSISIKSNKVTYLYGTKASKKDGKVERQNGDFMRFTGPARMEWIVNVENPGTYQVNLTHGVKSGSEGNQVSITSSNSSIVYSLIPTQGAWGTGSYERMLLNGKLELKAGNQIVTLLIPEGAKGDRVMDFRCLELIPVAAKSSIHADQNLAFLSRANSNWLAKAGYGLMFHWTSQSVNEDGTKKPYAEAVDDFDLNAFVKMVQSTGAGYVLFTIGHAEAYCPAPLQSWEKYHPGHTTKRDLINEMAIALNAKGIKLMCYFPTHVVGKYKKVPGNEFTKINNEVMTEFGKRYGEKVAGYWFDGWYQCFEQYPDFSFKDFFKACKAGNPNRIIALNSWIYPAVTEWQEYWAGEAASPVALPESGTMKRGPGKGLRYQSLIIMEPYWVQAKAEMPDPRFTPEELSKYIRDCMERGGAVTINMGIYQNGTVGKKALEVMTQVKKIIRNDSIMKMQSGPFEPDKGSEGKYFTKHKGNKIFIHVVDWKNQNNLFLPPILDRLVKRAWFLGDSPDTKYSWGIVRQAPWGTLVIDPEMKKGRIIVLEVEGDPKELAQPRLIPLNLADKSSVQLGGDVAALQGNLTYVPGPDYIDSWTGSDDEVKWRVLAPASGEYEVDLTYASPAKAVGSEIEISCGQGKLKYLLTTTQGWVSDSMNFGHKLIPGHLHLKKGENTIVMREVSKKPTDYSIMKLYSLELISPDTKKAQDEAKQRATQKRVTAGWFAAAKYGLMVHWMPGVTPRSGQAKSFPDAVRDFNVNAFADMVKQSGASYLIFTAVHGTQWFPGPSEVHERILPGRSCDRDLIGDLANAMQKRGVKLILYYHHGVGDYEWSKASGFFRKDKSNFFKNEYDILAEVGNRYGKKIAGWWFDDRYPGQPFEKLYEATKIGNPERIVAWNSWIMPKSTEFQDYYAGEAAFTVKVPDTSYFKKGGPAEALQPHFLIIADDPWAHTAQNADIIPPLYKDEELIHYVKAVNALGGPVTINIGIYQDGTVSPDTLQQVQKLGHTLGVLE
jgi:alpha-L-fucosidase